MLFYSIFAQTHIHLGLDTIKYLKTLKITALSLLFELQACAFAWHIVSCFTTSLF